jgi:alkanesulfonate monooxygenase SsuD/methylene tetrahydromethanopterin reductase-like flavin-dependent oxidoreductase (luciferase family)
VKVGITLPSFVDDPEIVIDVARAAEAAGVDGVFAYDHLFRVAKDGTPRPALECSVVLGAVAAETKRISIGSLVVRATLRPPATLAAMLDTVQRISGGRLLAALGAGDSESKTEMETYGLPFGTVADRLAALDAAVAGVSGRGYPVWVGGSARMVGRACRAADGWNRWGASPASFERELGLIDRRDDFTASWGGLVVMGEDEASATAKAERLGAGANVLVGGPDRIAEGLRAYEQAGASWVMLGPIDSSDPDNATQLGERVKPLVQ